MKAEHSAGPEFPFHPPDFRPPGTITRQSGYKADGKSTAANGWDGEFGNSVALRTTERARPNRAKRERGGWDAASYSDASFRIVSSSALMSVSALCDASLPRIAAAR